MAIAMPPSVIVLIVAPNARSTSTAAASESGIAVSVIAAARRLARKRTTIDDDEEAAVAQRLDDVVDGDLDEVRLPEDPAIDRHAGRQLALHRVELAIEPGGQLDGVRARLLLHADDDGGAPLREPSPRLSAAPSRTSAMSRTSTDRSPCSAIDAVADLLWRARAPDRLQDVLLRALECRSRRTCSGSRRARRPAAR